MKWKPIETAPKDGSIIVAVRAETGRSGYSFISWDDEDGWCGYTAEDVRRLVKYQPTHWLLRLPDQPEADQC